MVKDLIALEDSNGTAYVHPDCIQGISGPTQKGNNPPSRKIILEGYVLYAIESEANCKALGIKYEPLPDDYEEAPKRKPRSRKPPYFRRGSAQTA